MSGGHLVERDVCECLVSQTKSKRVRFPSLIFRIELSIASISRRGDRVPLGSMTLILLTRPSGGPDVGSPVSGTRVLVTEIFVEENPSGHYPSSDGTSEHKSRSLHRCGSVTDHAKMEIEDLSAEL